MAKQGLTTATVGPILRTQAATRGWALCVGAGTSYPEFPSWEQLVRRMIVKDVPAPEVDAVSSRLLEIFTPDALLQAAADRLKLTGEEFVNLLIAELYVGIKDRVTPSEWKIVLRALSTHHVGAITQPTWSAFSQIRDTYFGTTSAAQVAPVIHKTLGTPVQPSAILSFNAEALFLACLNAELAEARWAHNSLPPDNVYETVIRSISARHQNRIPYYFCHGLLRVPARGRIRHSADKLVFSEAAYLQLANSSFSWQSTAFLSAAMSQSIVFIGVSLSDSNMRRWLSWSHANREAEIREYNPTHGASAIHYWITRAPASSHVRRWTESSVAHLGVRVIWIDEWNEVAVVLATLLGL
jgi:hypothetical protein